MVKENNIHQVRRYKCELCGSIEDVRHKATKELMGIYIKCANRGCLGSISSGTMKLQMEFSPYDESLLTNSVDDLISTELLK